MRLVAAAMGLILGGGAAAQAGADVEPVAGAMLPAGEGRDILKAACVSCHDLGGLPAFACCYGADHWRALLATMVEHGAELDEAQLAALADYLARHFGPGAGQDHR